MKRKISKANVMKSIFMAVAVALTLSVAIPAPTMAQAAGKTKLAVTVKSPKKNVKLSGTTLTAHTKSTVTLTVKSGSRNVTTKATYKTSNKKVLSVSKKGKITAKKNGTATLTVKYNGTKKNYKVIVAGHNWKAHKATTTVKRYYTICNCGVNLTKLEEKKYCAKCQTSMARARKDGICVCKSQAHRMNHIRNGEPSSYSSKEVTETVTYTDYYTCSCGTKKAGEPEPK